MARLDVFLDTMLFKQFSSSLPHQSQTRPLKESLSEFRLIQIDDRCIQHSLCSVLQSLLLKCFLKSHLRQNFIGKHRSEWSSLNKTVAGAWRNLSEEEKAHYRAKAIEVQGQRSVIARTPLNEAPPPPEEGAEAAHLSTSQRKRLNQSRLDGALAQVAHHPAWQAGLGLSDHISGLRSSMVDLTLAETDGGAASKLEGAIQNFFGYDQRILNNPQLPPFDRACMVPNGGVCSSSPLHPYVAKLVEQLDSFLSYIGKLSQRVVIKFTLNHSESAGRISDSTRPMWFALGCTARKPKAHILISLDLQRVDSCLTIHAVDGVPQLQTSHQLFHRLLWKHRSQEHLQLAHFGLEVPTMSVQFTIQSSTLIHDSRLILVMVHGVNL